MNSICYIVLYFGKLPNSMSCWLESCALNDTVNWILYTDDKTKYDYPPNVSVCYTTFKEMVERIQDKFDFPISIDTPYRLCDYKVSYGYIFEDELKVFDYWGYCDLDMIFGDIRSFITDEIAAKFDKIGFLGHSTLYKNNSYMNRLFMRDVDGNPIYKKIFSTSGNVNQYFDEKWINLICEQNGVRCYQETIFADIIPWAWKFRIGYANGQNKILNEHRIFLKEGKKLFSYAINQNREISVDEFMYIHLLKRTMKYSIKKNCSRFLIIPNRCKKYEKQLSKFMIYYYSINNMILYWLDIILRKWKKISVKNVINYFKIRTKAQKNYYSEG